MNKIFNNYFRYTAFADDSSHHDDHVDGAGNKHSQGIKYLGVARKEAGAAGDCVVIASFAKVVSHKVDKYAIKKAITNIQSDQHCYFAVGESVWSVLVDDINLVYILTCSKEYPQRCAVLCLQELQTIFRAKAGHKCFTSSHDGLSGSFHSQFSKLFEKYNDTKSVDSVIRASSKVDGIKLVMQQNIELSLQNAVKLEDVRDRAENLSNQASVFKKKGKELKNNMQWRNIKTRLILGALVLLVLGSIAGIISYAVVSTKKQQSSKQ